MRRQMLNGARRLLTVLAILVGAGTAVQSAESNGSKPASGYTYYRDEVPEVPWSIQVVKIDRANPHLQLHTTVANGDSIGLTTLPHQIKLLPESLGRPIVAMNGDYYQAKPPYRGDPKGVQISRGELISAPFDWTCMWVDSSGTPYMGKVESGLSVTWPNKAVTPVGLNEQRSPSKAVLYSRAVGKSTRTTGGLELVLEKVNDGYWLPLRAGEQYDAVVREVREAGDSPTSPNSLVLSIGPKAVKSVPKVAPGAVLRISTETTPSLKGVPTAISGGPALVRSGKVEVGWSAIRHPRSAVGWNKDYIFLVQVDGRQSSLSVGMTYSELAAYMLKLGCEEALNLDGGGSATFWVLGQVINSPSEGEPRGIANGLVLVQKASQETTAEPAVSKAEKDFPTP